MTGKFCSEKLRIYLTKKDINTSKGEHIDTIVTDQNNLIRQLKQKEMEYKRKRQELDRQIRAIIVVTISIIVCIVLTSFFWNTVFAYITGISAFILFIVVFILLSNLYNDDGYKKHSPRNVRTLETEVYNLQIEKQLFEDQLSPLERYKNQIPQMILDYQNQANNYRRKCVSLLSYEAA